MKNCCFFYSWREGNVFFSFQKKCQKGDNKAQWSALSPFCIQFACKSHANWTKDKLRQLYGNFTDIIRTFYGNFRTLKSVKILRQLYGNFTDIIRQLYGHLTDIFRMQFSIQFCMQVATDFDFRKNKIILRSFL